MRHDPDALTGDEPPHPTTYTGTRNEQAWIEASLGEFFDDQLITDVLYKVKGGKEANVYCCAANRDSGFELLAAKLYRPTAFRAMRNDRLYRIGRSEVDGEGKTIRDSRAQRAMHKRTKMGQAMRSFSWIHHEYEALIQLYSAGCAVPEPVAINERAIMMRFVGDTRRAASTLHEVRLDVSEAVRLYKQVEQNLEAMLTCGRIHGDLSAYNILYDEGEAVIIDLPQTVDPLKHPDAFALLQRDADRVCSYFRKQGVDCDAADLTARLWRYAAPG